MAGDSTRQYHIPAQSLNNALMQFATDSNLKLLFTADKVRGLNAGSVDGTMTPAQALSRLLQDSGMTYRFVDAKTVTVEQAPSNFRKTAEVEDTTLGKVQVEDDYDPNDPYNTGDPYNKSYSVTNSTTATKTDTPIMDTPLSVQVVTKQVLKDQQAFRLQDALKNVSGVQQYSTNGGTLGGNDAFVVRGVQLGSGWAGARYRNSIRIANSNADFANLDRIEVLKGPASGSYGRIEPGGLIKINLVTKKASTEPYYSVEQRFGSYDYYRTEANATGPLTKDGSLAYRLDLSYLDTESFRDFLLTTEFLSLPV